MPIVGAILVLSVMIAPGAAAARVTANPVLATVLAVLFAELALVGGTVLSLAPGLPVSGYVAAIAFVCYVGCRVVARCRGRSPRALTERSGVSSGQRDQTRVRSCWSRVSAAARRRRATSASTTPAATDALSDSTGPAIGIETVTSQVWRTSRRQALALRADHQHQRVGGQLELVEATPSPRRPGRRS